MPTWGELLAQISAAREAPLRVYDEIMQSSLAELSSYTKLPVIVYASGFLQKEYVTGTSMSADDVSGFMEVLHGLLGDELYLVVHSPGGSAEAAEGIVKYLRARFRRITAVVPHQAKSAATMLACAAEKSSWHDTLNCVPSIPRSSSRPNWAGEPYLRRAFATSSIERPEKSGRTSLPL